MNNDLISRAAAIKVVKAMTHDPDMGDDAAAFGCMVWGVLDRLPAVDAEPVRHGRWAHMGGDEWYCTVCTEVIHTEGSWEKPTDKYCHECGAKMDAEVTNG